jgi:hypothetical protein
MPNSYYIVDHSVDAIVVGTGSAGVCNSWT